MPQGRQRREPTNVKCGHKIQRILSLQPHQDEQSNLIRLSVISNLFLHNEKSRTI